MSLTPAFEIGLWNAWIFTLPYILVDYGLSFLIVNKESPLFTWLPYIKSEKKLYAIVFRLTPTPLSRKESSFEGA